MWKRIAVAAVLCLVFGPASPARANVGEVSMGAAQCRDHTPGVVTHWEYKHAVKGLTRHEIRCRFGVRGHSLGGFWAGRNFHLVIRYPNIVGTAVDVTFVDWGATGSNYHLTRIIWYRPDTAGTAS